MCKSVAPHHVEGHVEWMQSTRAGMNIIIYNYVVAIVNMISSDGEILLVSI